MRKEVFRMENICYEDPGGISLSHVSLHLDKGEILGIAGMDGAGKSTLARIIAGVLRPDTGIIRLDGRRLAFESPFDAGKAGIGYIREEPKLLCNMTVAENLFMGKRGNVFLHPGRLRKQADALLRRYHFDVESGCLAGELTLAQRKLVEIARVLGGNPSLLVMDDIMGSLSGPEIDNLFEKIRAIAQSGISILFLSHELKYIYELSDRILVLREGSCVYMENARPFRREAIERAAIPDFFRNRRIFASEPDRNTEKKEILRVEHLSGRGFYDIGFSLYEGEILGFTGIAGSGRSSLMRCICGACPDYGGTIYIEGEKAEMRKPADALARRIGYVRREREEETLVPGLQLKKNISLCSLERISRRGILRPCLESLLAQDFCRRYRIAGAPDVQVKALSNVDREKTAIAVCMAAKPRILILEEPLKGLDEAGKKEIMKLLIELKQKVSLIVIAGNLNETVHLFDRTLVMHKGRITGGLGGEIQERGDGYDRGTDSG